MITAKVIKDKDGLNVGEEYEVRSIDMGQSYTSIYLETPKEGTKNPFNSVIFDFYEYGEEVNIFSDRRFNPYLEVDADDDDTPGDEDLPLVSPRLFYVVAHSQYTEGNWEQISNGFDTYEKAVKFRDDNFCKARHPNAFIVASLNEG